MGFEFKILDSIQCIRTPFLDALMRFITSLGNGGIIWIILTAVLLIVPKKRKSGAILAVALLVDFIICNCILKGTFRRIRPFDVNTAIQLIINRPMDFSFPSGHTAIAFASFTALRLAGEKKICIPVFILACSIAFSRMYLYVHYPTDILGGVAAGIASGCIAFAIVYIWSKRRNKNNFRRSVSEN